MRKILLFLSILFLMPLIFAYTDLGAGYYYTNNSCFQETANISTSCGGLSTGTYNTTLDFTDNSGYLNINYTVPSGMIDSYWRVKHGALSTYNVSLGSCFNYTGKLILRFYSKGGAPGTMISFGQCYNGTNWNNITNIESAFSGSSIGSMDTDTIYMYDGDYSTFSYVDTNQWQFADDGIKARIYEEAVYWINLTNSSTLYENLQTFNHDTYESSTETYTLNLTYNSISYPIITANLIYNNTNYTGTNIGSGSNPIFTANVIIPNTNGSAENKSFYWNIGITNATGTYYYNSTFKSQRINPIDLGECTVSRNITALNFTFYDEKNLLQLQNLSFQSTINYFIGSSITPKTTTISNTSTSLQQICISNHLNYTITANLQLNKEGYNPTDYNYVNQIINNITMAIQLYLLPVSNTTAFILKVQDQSQLPLANYYIYIYRYDPGSFTPYLVQVTKTDSDGKSIGFFEINTVDYEFVITDNNGNIVHTTSKRKIIPETTPYTITFTVGTNLPSPFSYYDNLSGMNYQLTYDKTTKIVTYLYTDSNSSFNRGNLIIRALNASGTNPIICNVSSTNPSAVLSCDLTGNSTGTYSATGYTTRNSVTYLVNQIQFDIPLDFGMVGILGGFFIILICCFLFAFNEVAGLVSVGIGVTFVNLIGLVNFGWVVICGVWALIIVLLIVLER